ncbi:MAG: cation transporter [Flavobacteriales bacterium]|nr:cation transporter [Flavobacteriales bacterium]
MDSTNITLPLLDVNSPHCALRVEKAIRTVPAITGAEVDLNAHVANLTSVAPAQAVREAVAAIRQAGYNVATEVQRFTTTGVTCAGCASSVGNILNKLPGVISARIDHVVDLAEVELVKDTLSLDDLLNALKPAGYGLIAQAA